MEADLSQATDQSYRNCSIALSEYSGLSESRKQGIEQSITHYKRLDKRIGRLPQFAQCDEFLTCLANSISAHVLMNLDPEGLQVQDETGKTRYEVIVENQRGTTVFGVQMYSNKSMLAWDPPKFETLDGHSLGKAGIYPLPDANWRWSWQNWHVLMINDVDEEGWIYSTTRFGSRNWKGKSGFFKFIRRRIWVRMAEKDEARSARVEAEYFHGDGPQVLVVNPMSDGDQPWRIYRRIANRWHGRKRDSKLDDKEDEEDDDIDEVQQQQEDNKSSDTPQLDAAEQVQHFSKEIENCTIDRIRIDKTLAFLKESDDSILQYLITDFNENCPSQSSMGRDTWIDHFLSTLQFHESRSMLLRRLEAMAISTNLGFSSEKAGMLRTIEEDGRICIDQELYEVERTEEQPPAVE